MGSRAGPGLAQTAAAAVLWGTSFPVVSLGIGEGLDPIQFLLLRFAAASPLMVLFARVRGIGLVSVLKTRAAWFLGALNAAGFIAQFVGQQYTGASVAAVLVNLSVILAAVGGTLFLGEELGRVKAAGVAAAFGGALLIATNGSSGIVKGEGWLGAALYVFAACTWAAYIVYAKRVTARDNAEPVALATVVVLVTVVLVAPAALFGGWSTPAASPILAVAYTAVFNTAIPFVLYQQGLRSLTVVSSAVVLMLEIVVALGVSVSVLGESLSPLAVLGAAGVLLSILLVSGREARGSRSSPPTRVQFIRPRSDGPALRPGETSLLG